MKHSIKIALITALISWYSSAIYYGFNDAFASNEAIPEQEKEIKLNVICEYHFPQLPVEILEDARD